MPSENSKVSTTVSSSHRLDNASLVLQQRTQINLKWLGTPIDEMPKQSDMLKLIEMPASFSSNSFPEKLVLDTSVR